MNCPICGYQAKENDRFCRSCGAVLENRVQSQTTPQFEQQDPYPIPQSEQQNQQPTSQFGMRNQPPAAPQSEQHNQFPVSQSGRQDQLRTSSQKAKKKKPVLTIILAILCVLLSAALLLNIFVFPASGRSSLKEKYFKTPEECCEYFVQQLSDLNFENAMATYATTSRAENFNFQAYVERIEAYSYYQVPLPGSTEKSKEIAALKNFASAQSDFSNLIFDLTIQRNIPEFDKTSLSYTVNDGIILDDYTIHDFEMFFNPELYVKGIELIELISAAELTSYHEFLSDKSYLRNKHDLMQVDGALEREEFVALFKQGNEYFIGGFTVSKYNNKGWQLDYSRPHYIFNYIRINPSYNAASQIEGLKITPNIYSDIITGKYEIY